MYPNGNNNTDRRAPHTDRLYAPFSSSLNSWLLAAAEISWSAGPAIVAAHSWSAAAAARCKQTVPLTQPNLSLAHPPIMAAKTAFIRGLYCEMYITSVPSRFSPVPQKWVNDLLRKCGRLSLSILWYKTRRNTIQSVKCWFITAVRYLI